MRFLILTILLVTPFGPASAYCIVTEQQARIAAFENSAVACQTELRREKDSLGPDCTFVKEFSVSTIDHCRLKEMLELEEAVEKDMSQSWMFKRVEQWIDLKKLYLNNLDAVLATAQMLDVTFDIAVESQSSAEQ